MSTVAKLLARLELDTTGFQQSLKGMPGMMSRIGGDFSQIGGTITNGITLPALAAGAAVIAIGGHAIKTGADFEKAMSGVRAILGATEADAKRLSDAAINLGMDKTLVVTAAEAAGVMEELAKNGLTTTEILNGATEAAIALANATGTDFATAADIASTSMQLFNLEAKDMESIVNSITAGANASRFSAEDFAQAIAMGGGMASAVGVDYEEFITVITGLSTSFASGSDAGTSFKTFLQRLVPDTKPAIAAMEELGIITEDGQNQFFTTTGELKSMSEVAEVLQNAMSGLSDEQKILALTNIFGTDALRAANAMAELGAEGFDALAESMSKVDAAANAETRMNNLAGAFEILGGIVEAFQIKFTQALGPGVRQMVEAFTGFLDKNAASIEGLFLSLATVFDGFGESLGPWLDENGPKMIEFVGKMIEALPGFIAKLVELGTTAAPYVQALFDAFMNADPDTIVGIMSAIGSLAAIGPALAVLGTLITTIASIISIVGAVGPAVSGMVTFFTGAATTIGGIIAGGIVLPLLLIIATVGLVVYAFATDFGGISTTVMQLGAIISWVFDQAVAYIHNVQTAILNLILSIVASGHQFTVLFEDGSGALLNLATAIGIPAQAAQDFLAKIFVVASQFKAALSSMGAAAGLIGSVFARVFNGIFNAIQKVIGKVMELASALMKLALPKALTPGSPTPFEIGLLGIADAMHKVNTTGLAGITNPTTPAMASFTNGSVARDNGNTPPGNKNVTIQITNPKKETSEESIKKTLNRLSYLRILE